MKNFKLLTCAAFTAFAVASCSPTHQIRGNLLQDYQLAEVQTGIDTQSDVLKKLGSPTTKAPFDDNIWYYIGQETEKKGILDPKVTDERIVALSFNEEGVLQDFREVDSERIELPYERSKTPTSGNELTILQQLLGNLGRFNTTGEE